MISHNWGGKNNSFDQKKNYQRETKIKVTVIYFTSLEIRNHNSLVMQSY